MTDPSAPEYTPIVERNIRVEMDDGVHLAVDLYRPDTDDPVPGLLTMTPYAKDIESVDVDPLPMSEGGHEFAAVEGSNSEFWARRGYAHAIADVRGCGLSEGEYRNLISPREATDGAQLVEWLAEQPWCTGKIGMVGISYLAFIQYLVAAERPPHLEAIFPHDGWGDTYRDVMYQGGIPSVFFKLESTIAEHSAVPVSTEYLTETEIQARVESLLEDDAANINTSPVMLRALLNPRINPIWFDILLHREDTEFWTDRRPAARMDRIEVPCYLGSELHRQTVPMHLPGAAHWGWDLIQSDTKLAFRPRVPNRPFKDVSDFHDEMLRWFDHHLKGIETGIMDEPPVKIWVRGAETYRFEPEWPPLAKTEWSRFYLREGERLRRTPAEGSVDPSEFEHDGRVPAGVFSDAPIGPEPDHLVFRSPSFETPIELTGPMSLTLYASLSTTDGDFIVLVRDVEPDGTGDVLTRGWLRASHREVDPDRSEPWRPYHPHTDPDPVTPGNITRFDIEIQPIASVFDAGHSLQVELWPMDYPPEEGYDETLFWGRVHHVPYGEPVTYEVYHDSSHPSHLLVPVMTDEIAGSDGT